MRSCWSAAIRQGEIERAPLAPYRHPARDDTDGQPGLRHPGVRARASCTAAERAHHPSRARRPHSTNHNLAHAIARSAIAGSNRGAASSTWSSNATAPCRACGQLARARKTARAPPGPRWRRGNVSQPDPQRSQIRRAMHPRTRTRPRSCRRDVPQQRCPSAVSSTGRMDPITGALHRAGNERIVGARLERLGGAGDGEPAVRSEHPHELVGQTDAEVIVRRTEHAKRRHGQPERGGIALVGRRAACEAGKDASRSPERGWAPRWIDRDQLEHDVGQGWWQRGTHARVELARHRLLEPEQPAARDQLEHEHAEREQVTPGTELPARPLFRRHVAGRPRDLAIEVGVRDRPRDAEVRSSAWSHRPRGAPYVVCFRSPCLRVAMRARARRDLTRQLRRLR